MCVWERERESIFYLLRLKFSVLQLIRKGAGATLRIRKEWISKLITISFVIIDLYWRALYNILTMLPSLKPNKYDLEVPTLIIALIAEFIWKQGQKNVKQLKKREPMWTQIKETNEKKRRRQHYITTALFSYDWTSLLCTIFAIVWFIGSITFVL